MVTSSPPYIEPNNHIAFYPSARLPIITTTNPENNELTTEIIAKSEHTPSLNTNTSTTTKKAVKMKGAATQVKVHFKGQDDDFLVFVDDFETYKKWQEDKSVPLAHFVSAFKIFVTHK